MERPLPPEHQVIAERARHHIQALIASAAIRITEQENK